ncbi:MAG: hypothetical protein JSU91_04615 [Thermoplasmatales archaeon]|nr:MAG: hypothetical protein JSU91_04615 [Thermoplasmatales archaeon]
MEKTDEDNIWKKIYRTNFWLGMFALIPIIVYMVIIEVLKSLDIAITFGVVSFLLWTLIFFKSGIYKDF